MARSIRYGLLFVLCAGMAGGDPIRQQTAPPPAVSSTVPAPERSFAEFLDDIRAEAATRGIGAATVERALAGIEPLAVVIERDRTQAEQRLALDEYLAQRITPAAVRSAREMARRHAAVLRRVAVRHGVPARIVVAIWGLESNFGRFTGTRPIIAALATLAYDARRSEMFREELFSALKILDHGDIDPDGMKGSWAGAMGQPQFMPSVYLQFAVDFDGDGRRDIWKTEGDIFASIGNYLQAHGWIANEPWGRAVRVKPPARGQQPEAIPQRSAGCLALRQMSEPRPLSTWRQRGITRQDGRTLPKSTIEASLVQAGRRNFLVYKNYEALLAYNCAHSYALSVGLLADRISTGQPPAKRRR